MLKLLGAAVYRTTYTLVSNTDFENIAEVLKVFIESNMHKRPIRISLELAAIFLGH
jgi:hypothetical protein